MSADEITGPGPWIGLGWTSHARAGADEEELGVRIVKTTKNKANKKCMDMRTVCLNLKRVGVETFWFGLYRLFAEQKNKL